MQQTSFGHLSLGHGFRNFVPGLLPGSDATTADEVIRRLAQAPRAIEDLAHSLPDRVYAY